MRSAGVGDDALGLRLTPSDPRQPAPDMLEDDVVDDEDDGEAWYLQAERFCDDLRRAVGEVGSPARRQPPGVQV